ncbi:MAG: lipid-A-disaccharide synthase, partial [Synergistaceae bacterium]|nr:lipid-A-disaccharide synthase [Synergistaceae bacterium]
MSAGEVSGDHYIARLSLKLRSLQYPGDICGLCGAESSSAGVEALWRSERLHLVGVSEVVGSIADILKLMGEMKRFVMSEQPRALIFADSPDFHLPLIRRLRRAGYGGKIFYVAPPSVWAWRSYRARDLIKYVDECLPLFGFEHEYLEKTGVVSSWIGHPLVEEFADLNIHPQSVADRIVKGVRAFDRDRVVALLPGSRRSEIEQLCPVLASVAAELASQGFSPVFSVAPGLSEGARNFLLGRLGEAGEHYYEGPGRDLMALSKAVAGSSGTATAEALLLRRYMVVMYKMKPLSAFIGRLLLSHLFFALPNLLAGEMFFPELIQGEATPEAVTRELMAWL